MPVPGFDVPENYYTPDMEDDRRQSAMDFLSWVIEDTNQIHAEVGTPRDVQLQQYVREGHLTFSFCAHGTNTYAITDKWLRSIA